MEQRNLIIAIVVSVAIMFGWQFLFEKPKLEKQAAQQTAQQHAAKTPTPSQSAPGIAAPEPPKPGAGSAQPPAAPTTAPPATTAADRAAVLRQSPRIVVSSPRLHGSIRTAGALFDDLTLADYHITTDRKSPEIVLLTPPGTSEPYFTQFGWVAADSATKVPNENTVWTASPGTLAPGKPVMLSWSNGQGLIFKRTIAVDENYMFTVTQQVQNTGAKPVTLYPFGLVSRMGGARDKSYYLLYEGPVGVLGHTLKEIGYDDLKKGPVKEATTGGWLGFTDKYWLVALVPDQKAAVQTTFRHVALGKEDKYQADYLGTAQTIAPGGTASVTDRLFAGAKEVHTLAAYREKLGIELFDYAIDFGWFWFFTKPIFYVLDFFAHVLGNFGLAILLLTVLIKGAFFPLANKSYAAMSRLKKLQPKITQLRERYKDDKAKMNEAMMRLYKEEKANPMAGCLPIAIQIPVFFSLYKVLYVTIEMRHAPFYGWIRDLSAPDPTNVLTLFGLISWVPPHILDPLAIGIWPIIMGITMFLQQKLNPAPADPTQAKVMMFLPVIFTFMLAHFPAGLVIYWAWNNTLSISQQWLIMRRMGVKAT
jgi:YidC/Oxa1 family membrane protein insertase